MSKLYFLLAAAFSSVALAVNPVTVSGANFVNNVTRDRFDCLGVDYQPGGASGFTGGSDPLSDPNACLRDAILLQELGANSIRIYNLDGTINHDECVSIFNAAGIYLLVDVNSPLPNGSLNRGAPWESYNVDYLTRVFQMVEAFGPYPNVLGFFVGNEVINQDSVEQVPAYLRAVTRDLKDYIAAHSPHQIPVGYSAADVRDELLDTWNYLGCELANATDSKIDFFGLNSYSYCPPSSFTEAQYDVLVDMFANTSIPVVFSETGCNKVLPRVFDEIPLIYGPQMTVLSGGFVYEYSNEVSDFGLVTLNDNGTVSLLQDFNNLRAQYNSLDLKLITTANDTATSQIAPTCSPSLITETTFLNNWDLPARPDGVDDLINNGISKPNVGKLVSVTTVNEPVTVYNVSGTEITGLKLKVLASDQSNEPGNNVSGGEASSSASSSGTASATGSTASSTSSGAALPRQTGGSVMAVLGAAAVGAMML